MQTDIPNYTPVVNYKNIIEKEIQNSLNSLKFRVQFNDEVADITSKNSSDYPFMPRRTILTPAPQFGWTFDSYTYLHVPEILLG
jgi:hypothetical protein